MFWMKLTLSKAKMGRRRFSMLSLVFSKRKRL